jgi:hypothetical protein
VNTRPLLVEEGSFYYDLDAYNDELPYWTKVAGRDHLVIPYSLATNDVKFMRGGRRDVTGINPICAKYPGEPERDTIYRCSEHLQMRTHNIAIAGFVFKRAIDRAESNDVEFDPQQFGKSTRDPLSTPFADAVKSCWFRRAGLVNGTLESIHSTICADRAEKHEPPHARRGRYIESDCGSFDIRRDQP